MKNNLASGFFGAIIVVILLMIFDLLSTVFPIYIPNIFLKEPINVSVNVDSAVSEAIETANENIVGISNYYGNQIASTGSGVIYKLTDDYVYIVTNNHVVASATRLEVELTSGIKKVATIVGRDAYTDLAVITIERGDIDHHITVSDASALKVGEFVIAIGNPLGLEETSTLGIISSKNRRIYMDINQDGRQDWIASVIQTDAAINPGNSGGALVNLQGMLVGINSMKISDANVEGIGFAIPSNLVMKIVTDLETHQRVIRPFLDLNFLSIYDMTTLQKIRYGVSDELYGLYIKEVSSYAFSQGLRNGDVILAINDRLMSTDENYIESLYQVEVGQEIELVVKRGNEELTINYTLTGDNVS